MSEAINFSNALNDTLGTPKKIVTNVLPESYKNVASKADKIKALRKAYSNVEGIGTNSDFGIQIVQDETKSDESAIATFSFDTQAVDNVVNQFKNPTRESYSKALRSLERLQEQAIVSNTQALQIKREMKHKTNPNHYGTKSTKRAKLSKPAKYFGDSKSIVYVTDKKGEVKPMTIKNAHKLGYL